MEMVIQISLTLIIAWLWYLGGQNNGKWIRYYVIPTLLGLYFGICNGWYLLPIMVLLCQSFRIGYGNYEKGEKNCWLAELTKDKNGWYVRCLWGAIVGLAVSYGMGIVLWYVLLNTFVNYLVSRLRITLPWADFLVGASIASILFA